MKAYYTDNHCSKKLIGEADNLESLVRFVLADANKKMVCPKTLVLADDENGLFNKKVFKDAKGKETGYSIEL